jgi:hypothetical protein
MRKVFSFLLVLLLVPIGLFCSACVPTDEDVAGTYKLVEVYSEGTTYGIGYAFKDSVLTGDSAVLVLNEDETASATYTDLDFGETINGTWEKKEKTVIFNSQNLGTIELQFEINKDGDLLLIIENNSVLKLKKID